MKLLLLILMLLACGDDEGVKDDAVAKSITSAKINQEDEELKKLERHKRWGILDRDCGEARIKLIEFKKWARNPARRSSGAVDEAERLFELKNEVEEKCGDPEQECEYTKESGREAIKNIALDIKDMLAELFNTTTSAARAAELRDIIASSKRNANRWHRISCLEGKFPYYE